MRKAFLLTLTFLSTVIAYSQLTGIKTIPGSYSTIAVAVAALNAQGTGPGGVTFNIAAGYVETSPDSIYLTATGTAINRIVFQKSGAGANPKITRTGAGLLATSIFGGSGDAVFIVESSDYLTIDGIDVAAADAGIEYGYYLRKTNGTDGCKNDTIRNCAISMTKGTSPYVTGIYSSNNFKGQTVSSATGVTVTDISGRNENMTLTGNNISNVFSGIYCSGFNALAPYNFYDQNVVIGTSGAGNLIQNFGGNATATSHGIYLIYQNGASVQYNTVNNTANSGTAALNSLYGVFHSTGNNSSFSISNNNINITGSAASPTVIAIYNNGATENITINSNTLALNNNAVSSTGGYRYIDNSPGSIIAAEINNNIFLGTIVNAGAVYLITNSNNFLGPNNISGNTTSGTLQTSANVTGYINSNASSGVENIFNNNFSNIALSGLFFNGINSRTSSGSTQNIYNNTISNITGTANTIGSTYVIFALDAINKNIYGNKIFSISIAGDLFGITLGGGGSNCNVYKNRVSDLSTSGGQNFQTLRGIFVTTGNVNLYNNIVGDFRAPSGNSTEDAIIGIALGSSPSFNNVYYNTIYLNATSSGTNFSTTGLWNQNNSTSAGSMNLRNNIIVNTSVPKGSGSTTAFRRLSSSLTTYALTSNNNLFYAGVPGTNNLIYSDGTNADQTLAQYKTRVSPRETNSVSENPPFLSIAGSSPAFLHINPAASTQVSNAGAPESGITDDFDGDLRNTITPDIGADEFQTALPVTLANLQGERRGRINQLSWATLTEINNSGFELQRSADENTFSSIGFVTSKAANGNSTGSLQYSFDDVKPTNGTNYYRLKQVDKDGRFIYSNIVFIKGLKLTTIELINAYPNPALSSLNIVIGAPANDQVKLMITDLAGKRVMQKAVDLVSGENNISLKVNSLPSGSYYLRIMAAGTTGTPVYKFVKQ